MKVNIDNIKPYPNNPNDGHDIEAIASSLETYGQQQPVVIDENGIIIAGHGRYFAMCKMGWKEVWVHEMKIGDKLKNGKVIDEKLIAQYRIADNTANKSNINLELAEIEIETLDLDLQLLQIQGLELEISKEGLTDDLKQRIVYALNWSKDFTEIKEKALELTEQEKGAVKELIQALEKRTDEEQIQSEFFSIARNNGINPGKFFKTVYRILLGVPHGPRLGPYILAMGKENVIEALKRVTEN